MMMSLCEKCPYSELFWFTFSLIRSEYGEISVSLRIQSECGKNRTRITPNMDTFYAVCAEKKKAIQEWVTQCIHWKGQQDWCPRNDDKKIQTLDGVYFIFIRYRPWNSVQNRINKTPLTPPHPPPPKKKRKRNKIINFVLQGKIGKNINP